MTDRDLRTAFEHLKEDVMNNVQTEERLEQITERRTWVRPAFLAFAGAAAVALIVGTAVLAFRPGDTDTTTPPATGTNPPPTTTVTETSVPPVVTDGPVGLPQLGTDAVLVTNADTFTALTGGSSYPFPDGVDVAVADGQGGLVVQRGDEIYRVEVGTADNGTEPLLDAASLAAELGPVTLRLQDVTLVDGEVRVLVIVAGGQEEQRYEEVWLLDPETGATESIYRTGAYEGGITRASLNAGTLVITRSAEGFTWFEFLDAQGRPIDVSNPKPDGAEFPVFVDQGVISPDGSTLVYLESDTPAPPEDSNWRIDLVVWDLVEGTEDRRMEIELGNWYADRMDFDGVGVVLGRIQWDGQALAPGTALRIESLDADAGIVTDTGVQGTPSLIKAGPASSTLGELEACPMDAVESNLTRTCLSQDDVVFPWINGCIADVFLAPSEFRELNCDI